MKRYLFTLVITMVALLGLGTQAANAQSTVPPIEDLIRITDLVDYSVTTTGNAVRTVDTVGLTCEPAEVLLGVVMSKTITLPAWSGTNYFDVAISTAFANNAPVYTEAAAAGGRTVTIGQVYNSSPEIIANWSILTQTALTQASVATIIGYAAGATSTAFPRNYVDYSYPSVNVPTGVIDISAVYNANTGGQPMTVTGQIGLVCLQDPKWYYIGSATGMNNYNPGTLQPTYENSSPVNVDLNGTDTMIGILADTHESVSAIAEKTSFTHIQRFAYVSGGGTRLFTDSWTTSSGSKGPDDRKICKAPPVTDGLFTLWTIGSNINVRVCSIPEASGYTESIADSGLATSGYKSYVIPEFITRAKDVVATDNAIIRPILIGYEPVTSPPTNCSSQYQLSSVLYADSVPAYNVSPFLAGGEYGEAITGLQQGQYYAIDIIDPPWLQGDSHPAANSFLAQFTTQWEPGPVSIANWFNPDQFPNGCVDQLELGKVRMYFYVPQTGYAPLYGIRAFDPAGNWDNNQLDLNYQVYNAIYTPEPSPCEATYKIGNLIEANVQIRADYREGGSVNRNHPWQPNQTYMVEISGEPWFDDGQTPSTAVDVSIDDGLTWVNIEDLTGQFCVSDAGYGMRRWFFTHITGRKYKIRAHDPNDTYLSNSGYVSLSVYTATNFTTDGPCNQTFTIGEQLVSNSVAAHIEDGAQVPLTFTIGTWYVVETVPAAFQENGTDSASADYSGANYTGREWVGLLDFPSASCSETTGIYQRMYYRAQYDKYWIRAASADPTWNDHLGNLNYKVYSADLVDPTNPPPASCEENYNQQRVLLSVNKVYSNNPFGTSLASLPAGSYALESLDGPWFNADQVSYELALFENNPLLPSGYNPPIECVVLLSDQKHIRAYFTIGAEDNPSITVYDMVDEDFTNNTGIMAFALYRVTGANEAPPIPDQPPATTCNSVCTRPDGILEVPNWLEYGRCTFSKFISFCPYHASALESSIDAFNTREPFKTFNEIATLPTTIKEQFDIYAWDNPTGGGENLQQPTGLAAAWYDILPNLPSDSPWNGGQIQIRKPMSTTYSTMCTVELTSVIGSRLGAPVCFMLNIMNGIGAIKWMQFVLDTVMLIILGLYISQGWLKQGG